MWPRVRGPDFPGDGFRGGWVGWGGAGAEGKGQRAEVPWSLEGFGEGGGVGARRPRGFLFSGAAAPPPPPVKAGLWPPAPPGAVAPGSPLSAFPRGGAATGRDRPGPLQTRRQDVDTQPPTIGRTPWQSGLRAARPPAAPLAAPSPAHQDERFSVRIREGPGVLANHPPVLK